MSKIISKNVIKNTNICIDIDCLVLEKTGSLGLVSGDLELCFTSRQGEYDVFENLNIFYVSVSSGIVKRYRTHSYCMSYKSILNS